MSAPPLVEAHEKLSWKIHSKQQTQNRSSNMNARRMIVVLAILAVGVVAFGAGGLTVLTVKSALAQGNHTLNFPMAGKNMTEGDFRAPAAQDPAPTATPVTRTTQYWVCDDERNPIGLTWVPYEEGTRQLYWMCSSVEPEFKVYCDTPGTPDVKRNSGYAKSTDSEGEVFISADGQKQQKLRRFVDLPGNGFDQLNNIDWGDQELYTVLHLTSPCELVFVVAPTYSIELLKLGRFAGAAWHEVEREKAIALARSLGSSLVWLGDLPTPSGFATPNNQCGIEMGIDRYTGTKKQTPGATWVDMQLNSGTTSVEATAGALTYAQLWLPPSADPIYDVILENGASLNNPGIQGSKWVVTGGNRSEVLSRMDQMAAEHKTRDRAMTQYKIWLSCGAAPTGWLTDIPSGWTATSPSCGGGSPLGGGGGGNPLSNIWDSLLDKLGH